MQELNITVVYNVINDVVVWRKAIYLKIRLALDGCHAGIAVNFQLIHSALFKFIYCVGHNKQKNNKINKIPFELSKELDVCNIGMRINCFKSAFLVDSFYLFLVSGCYIYLHRSIINKYNNSSRQWSNKMLQPPGKQLKIGKPLG